MLKEFLRRYFAVPLIYRVGAAFVVGVLAGIVISRMGDLYGPQTVEKTVAWIAPFGNALIAMLKMIVIPIIFFSLVSGAASLPIRKFGRLGTSVLGWYIFTSLFATVFGVILAVILNPRMQNAMEISGHLLGQVSRMKTAAAESGGFSAFLEGLFMNPFEALASGILLPVIVFAILFGLAARSVADQESIGTGTHPVEQLLSLFDALLKVCFRIIDWIMEYFPIGVFALTAVNFALYGPALFGPYLRIAGCVVIGVLGMLILIYPLFVLLLCRENPYRFLLKIRPPVIAAFLTRSSAAALPVSFRTAEELGIRKELSGFALPLGATINMDGACIHLPVFAILAANMFDVELTMGTLALLVLSVVFASIGAGGIPGGSVFLLFMVLANMGLSEEQVAMIVALAIGINPLLDMFETACNVAGDNVCNYIVAHRSGMMDPVPPPQGPESGN